MKMYTNEQVADVIMNEGIGYAIMDYFSLDRIEDPELRQLMMDAWSAMNQIDIKLEEYYE